MAPLSLPAVGEIGTGSRVKIESPVARYPKVDVRRALSHRRHRSHPVSAVHGWNTTRPRLTPTRSCYPPNSLALVAMASNSDRTCYTPAGKDRNAGLSANDDSRYRPCPGSGKVTMCCGRRSIDRCVDGGLCFNTITNLYFRESCTDPTWQDPACIKLFLNGTGYVPGDEVFFGKSKDLI